MKKILFASLLFGLAACHDTGMTYNNDTQTQAQADRRMQYAQEYNAELSQSHGHYKTNVHQSENGFPIRRPYGCSPGQASKGYC